MYKFVDNYSKEKWITDKFWIFSST